MSRWNEEPSLIFGEMKEKGQVNCFEYVAHMYVVTQVYNTEKKGNIYYSLKPDFKVGEIWLKVTNAINSKTWSDLSLV